METAYEYYTDEKQACVSSNEKKVVNHILALAEEYPDEVYISSHPGSNLGAIVAYVPRSWIRLPRPPKKRSMTDEQRKAVGERLRATRNTIVSDSTTDEDESDE